MRYRARGSLLRDIWRSALFVDWRELATLNCMSQLCHRRNCIFFGLHFTSEDCIRFRINPSDQDDPLLASRLTNGRPDESCCIEDHRPGAELPVLARPNDLVTGSVGTLNLSAQVTGHSGATPCSATDRGYRRPYVHHDQHAEVRSARLGLVLLGAILQVVAGLRLTPVGSSSTRAQRSGDRRGTERCPRASGTPSPSLSR